MDPISHTLAASSANQAAPRVRVFADRKGRRCGLTVGMAISVAVVLFLLAGYSAVFLVFQIVEVLKNPDTYVGKMPLEYRISAWASPPLMLLTSTFLGMWLIAAARTYSRYVRATGEVHQLARMLREQRTPDTRASGGLWNG